MSPPSPSPSRSPRRSARPGFTLGRPGFTLIEMMAVVTIIAICAGLAAPSVSRILDDRRGQTDAVSVLSIMQSSRSRAFGRGGAVSVTWNSVNLLVDDHMQDVDGTGGVDTPSPNCAAATSRVSHWLPDIGPAEVVVNANSQIGLGTGAVGQIELCFTPKGSTFIRTGTNPFVRQTNTIRFDVGGGASNAKLRTVEVLPGGLARMPK
jgi:type IV fimbrial biogenesis protein FimT